MTTVGELALRVMRQVTDVLEGTATDGGTTYLTDAARLVQENEFYDNGTLWLLSGSHAGRVVRITGHASQRLTFEYLNPPVCVQQAAVVTVSGSVTGSGNAAVTVTAAGMPTQNLAVAVLNGDSAADAAGKMRTALNANAVVKNFFTVGGSGADIRLTTKTARANDLTLGITVGAGSSTGLATVASVIETAGVAGPRYAAARKYFPFEQVVSAMQSALDETWVTGEDDSLTGDGEALVFALPTGVYDVRAVRFEREGVLSPVSTHWHEEAGELRFDDGYAPYAGDAIHVYYRARHDVLTGYATEIHAEIDREWLVMATMRELLFWGAGMYGTKNEYMIEDRLNKALGMLKGKRARRGGLDVVVKTAGGSSDYPRFTR